MDTNQPRTGSKQKVDLQCCKRLVLLARYRIEESDHHEALTVFQEALMLANPNQYDTQLLSEIGRLRCQLCVEVSELLMKMGRPHQARLFAQEAIELERENSKATGLISHLRQHPTAKLPPPTEQAV